MSHLSWSNKRVVRSYLLLSLLFLLVFCQATSRSCNFKKGGGGGGGGGQRRRDNSSFLFMAAFVFWQTSSKWPVTMTSSSYFADTCDLWRKGGRRVRIACWQTLSVWREWVVTWRSNLTYFELFINHSLLSFCHLYTWTKTDDVLELKANTFSLLLL